MATILEVAKLAKVSKSTVSRVVSNNGTVSPKSRLAVEAAIKQLGYRPNQFARGLKSNQSNLIGVVVVDISSPFYTQLLGGIQSELAEVGKEMIVASGFGQADTERKSIEAMIDRHCDGLILYLESPLEHSEQLLQNIPTLTLGGSEQPSLPKISVENKRGGYLAAKHLIDLGHHQLVHLAGLQHYSDARDRLNGFWQAVDEAGIPRNQCLVVEGEYNEQFGYKATNDLLNSGKKFTAICAGDDDIAAGCYSAIRDHKLSIPNDISIIGYDDNFHAKYMFPPLTTIAQPVAQMGELAAKQLMIAMTGKIINDQQTMEPTLIKRESAAELHQR